MAAPSSAIGRVFDADMTASGAAPQRSSTIREVPIPVVDWQRIPAARYHDRTFFEAEVEHLWPHVWQMACRLEEIPEIGDWVEYTNLDMSVLVARTRDGVKAFHNACRHRGVQLGLGQGNCRAKGFVCPFHGWRWDMEGRNTYVHERQLFDAAQLDAADLHLRSCRVEVWGGSAFINLDDDAPSLAECLGPLAERLDARNIADLKVDWWSSTVLPVNWKLAMEAFMESYHLMRTHPQLHALSTKGATIMGAHGSAATDESFDPQAFVDQTIRHLAEISEGMGGMVQANEVAIARGLADMPLPDSLPEAAKAFYARLRREITDDGRRRGAPVPDLNEIAVSHPVKAVEYMFPHFFVLPAFSAMSAYRIRPLGPQECLFETWSLAMYPEDEQRPRPVAPKPTPYDDPRFPEVPRQDYANLPRQQRGLRTPGFEFMRLSRDVEGLISNYQRLIDGYLGGVEPARLAHGSRIVCRGLDMSIADLGF
jgi:phenylpropionate dioxygenase-like ring-hydroxylating dioxygenase large terminal subunit